MLFSLLSLCVMRQASAACKPHVITFGKTMSVKWYAESDETSRIDLKVRPLYVDARLKEYTSGSPHDITDRLLVVQRAFRFNDNLPQEPASAPRWRWQRGGWLLVDRLTGRVSPVNLPDFDPLYSTASWYRDYIAYCGISDDGRRIFAVVAQLGRRKAVVKRPLASSPATEMPDSACTSPNWQRQPVRVTFEPTQGDKITFSVRGHVADVINDTEEEEGSE